VGEKILKYDSILLLMMSYNPREYWLTHGRTYKEEFQYNRVFELQERILIDYMKRNVSTSSFSTVLEIGCGFGRVTNLLLTNFSNILEYHALDISPDQIKNAKELLKADEDGSKQEPNLSFAVGDITSLEVQKKYDLVIASEVLMHILRSDIRVVLHKLVKSSNKHVINIDWYEEQMPRKAAPHNFIHQYEALYKEIPEVLNISKVPIAKKGSWLRSIDAKQCLFHVVLRS
jgi:SAM-dependent methyltransferase